MDTIFRKFINSMQKQKQTLNVFTIEIWCRFFAIKLSFDKCVIKIHESHSVINSKRHDISFELVYNVTIPKQNVKKRPDNCC